MDIVLVILPKIEPDAPTTGPALLKTCAIEAGFSAKVIDFNIELYRTMKENGYQSLYFYNNIEREENFFKEIIQEKFDYLLQGWIDKIVSLNPKFCGFSLLTDYSMVYALHLSERLKKQAPHIKIIWGGAGIMYRDCSADIDRGILDYYVRGDGEKNIVNILRGIEAVGINDGQSTQLDNLNESGMPDYSDIDWSLYESKYSDTAIATHVTRQMNSVAYVTGSRGCVKSCDFCNVGNMWPRYRFRTAEHLMQEIRHLVLDHGRTTIKFTDSLINGSMKEYRRLLEQMVVLKQECPEFKWESQWIIRSPEQSPEEDYKLMAQSGCYRLDIGLESFSQKVRYDMGKKFTDSAMWFCFDMLVKYNMWCALLMIVGYPTETDEDHQITLDCIKRIATEGYANHITFSFQNTLIMHKGDRVYEKYKDGMVYWDSMYDWQYKENSLTVRHRRLKEIYVLTNKLIKYGDTSFDTSQAKHHVIDLERMLLKKKVMVPSSRIELL